MGGLTAGLAASPAAAQDAPQAAEDQAQPQARPQVGTAVAAVVNDHPISTFDVQQRVRLMMATSGAQLSEEALVQMQRQALRDLVEERLKLQEAERFELTIPDEAVDEELARIAASGGGSPEALARDLAQQGIAIETLREKIRAERAWEELVQGRYGPRVNISEGEVEDVLADLREQSQTEQFLLSEICLPLESQAQAEQMRQVGMQMIDQMRQGVPFQALAEQFSACPSAARGGDLGWLRRAEMSPEIAQIVQNLQEGNVSLPVPTQDGMMVMVAVRQKRDAAEAGEPSYQVAYAGAPKSLGREAAETGFARLKQANPCTGDALSVDLGEGVGVNALPMMPASAFAPQFQPVLADLERGEQSDILESETAFHSVLMCARDEGLGLPSRGQIENRLAAEELDRLSRRYLRDVERDSAVDLRIATGG